MQKNYLINFIATMHGDKMTIKQLQKLQTATRKAGKAAGVASKGMDRWDRSMMNVAKRALAVAPVWMLLRGAIMLVTSTIREAIQANMAFQENMARIRTVVTASSKDIEGDMTRIRASVLGMATKSRFALGELTEGFYFLRTAGLDTNEALKAYESTVQTATGTTNSLKDTTRIVVGIYNTMGKSLDDTLSTEEKFIQINDALTYTYATQEVQLQELGQSYIKLAPYLSGLSDEFIDIITMLGFLNTKLLKSGRAGRLLGRTMLQLTKNSKQLAEIFGITFDPNKPINFLDTLKKIHVKMGDTAKITASQSDAIQEVFATRAGVPIRLLLDNFEEFIGIIERARVSSKGFSEVMNDIMMHTVSAQMKRLNNIIAVSANEFFSAASAGGDFVSVLENLNDALESKGIPMIKEYGMVIGYLTSLFLKGAYAIEFWEKKIDKIKSLKIKPILLSIAFPGRSAFENIPGLAGYKDDTKEDRKKSDALNKQTVFAKKVAKARKIQETADSNTEKEHLRHKIALLKEAGATVLEIARFKMKEFEASEIVRTEEDKKLELLKLQHNVLEAQEKTRNKITNTFMKAQTDLLKAQGASELQILQAQLIQLQNQEGLGRGVEYLTRLTNIRIKQALVLADIKQKELKLQTNVALQYERADKFDKPRIRRAMELRGMDTGQLEYKWSTDAYDKGIILEYWSYFTEKQQEAFGKLSRDKNDFNQYDAPPAEDSLPYKMKKELLNEEDLVKYWDNWSTIGRKEVSEFAEWYKNTVFATRNIENAQAGRPLETEDKYVDPRSKYIFRESASLKVQADIGHDIEVTLLYDESWDDIPKKVGKAVEEKLKKAEVIEQLAKDLKEII